MTARRGIAVREQGHRRVSLVTRTTALLSAAAAGVLGMVFAGQAPASTSTGADVGNAVAPAETGSAQPDTTPAQDTATPADVQPADSGSATTDSSAAAPTRSVPRHVTPRTVVSTPPKPVVRAPVTPPAPVAAPVTHRTHVRSGGS